VATLAPPGFQVLLVSVIFGAGNPRVIRNAYAANTKKDQAPILARLNSVPSVLFHNGFARSAGKFFKCSGRSDHECRSGFSAEKWLSH
jgi:hypothetical protein